MFDLLPEDGKFLGERANIEFQEDNKGNGLNNPKRKYSYRKLAEKFGVSHNLIKQIVKGECRNNG